MNFQETPSEYKLPPQAIEFEESILSTFLLGQNKDAIESLSKDDFYKPANEKIFSAIIKLIEKKEPVDLITVTNILREEDQLNGAGGAPYLVQLIDHVPISTNIEYHIAKVKEKVILRKMIKSCQEISQKCFEDNGDIEQLIDNAQNKILNIEINKKSEAVRYDVLSATASDRYDKLYKNKNLISGLETGFYLFDKLTSGLQKSDLIILAGRPGHGKSALALNIAGNISKKNHPVLYFSLEMSCDQLFDRQIANTSGVNTQKFRSGWFSQNDWNSINYAQSKVYNWPIFIDETPALNYMEIKRRARYLKKKENIKLVIIDHLQLIKGDKLTNRDREIGSITGGLKALAKELNIPVLLLSQLNRQLEKRQNPNKRPMMSDLRDSGNIEQDADIIAFLYQPAVYKDVEEFEGHTELNIGKHRNGPTGMIKLKWEKKITTFVNPAKEAEY